MHRAVLLLLGLLLPLAARGDEALLEAAYEDDLGKAKALLADGADPNEANRYGVRPLSLACRNGNAEFVALLLDSGADAKAALEGGETPLHTAARTGEPEPVRLLLKAGAAVDAGERKGQTPLMWAAAEGNAAVVQLLLDARAEPERRLKSGFDGLLFACRQGHIAAAETLLMAGLDVNAASEQGGGGRALKKGSTPLSVAIENGHFDLARMLLKAGADPNDARTGYAPLHQLVRVRKPNRGDGLDGQPPPIGSGRTTSLQFAQALLDAGAEVNKQLSGGSTGGHRLASKGATPFLLASRTADLPYLKLLHAAGADPHLPNADGTTPLLAAAGRGTHAPTEEAGTEEECLAAVAYLLELGADLDTVDRNGETAMHGAAYKSLPKMVAFLAESGADIEVWNQKNRQGKTPLLLAQGFRPGNFKPAPDTVAALEKVMRAAGIDPPPPPERKEDKVGYEK